MLTGKQREIQQRDTLFLQVARDLLLEEGYHGLTMERVAKITQFSKGTVYNRFACKEDMVVELGRRCREERVAMLERALTFEGRPRERMVALGEGAEHFSKLFPNHVRVLAIINAEAILEKVGEEQRARMKAYDARVMQGLTEIVQAAVACGDLALPPRSTPQEISFALWALVDGASAAFLGGAPLAEAGIGDVYSAISRGCHMLMDGCGWRPLSTEWNYSETSLRIKASIFQEEARAWDERQA